MNHRQKSSPSSTTNTLKAGFEDGKLGRLLSLFKDRDWDRLRLFLDSPYFNRSPALRTLFEYYWETIVKAQPAQEDEAVYQRVYPGQMFDPIKLKNIRAAFQRKVDDFMAQSAYEADEPLQARMRLRKLNMLTENEYFPRYCLRAKEMPQECFLDEENRRLHLYYLSAEDEIAKSRHQDRTRLLEGSIAAYQYAWEFFQLQTMRHIIGMLNAKNITGREVDLRIAEAILKLIPIDQESLPAIMLYRQSLEMHMRPDEPGILESFLAKLHHYADKMLISDARYLFRSALNFCLLRGNKGEEGTNYASLEIYKEMDKRDLFLVEGCIPATLFKELVTQGILCKDFEWTDRVIQKYESLVAGDPDKTTANFNRGFLHYCKQEYVEAQRCLHRVLDHYDDVFFGFDARILLLRIYYETQSFQAMDSFIDSFKMYVKRNKRVGKSKIELGLNAAKLFRKLVHVKPWDLTALEKLEAEVSSTPVNPSSKSWFLDQTMLLLSKARSLPNSRVKHRR